MPSGIFVTYLPRPVTAFSDNRAVEQSNALHHRRVPLLARVRVDAVVRPRR